MIQHYIDAILAHGSADGYNSESPERLHIDFAKEGYRASNKRDFLEQMAIWLQRQEAMFLHTTYLTWLHPTPVVDVDDGDVDTDDGEDDGVLELERSTSMSAPKHWYVAKRPPFRNVTIDYLETHHLVPGFLVVFSEFLKKHSSRAPHPSQYDRFDVYKQMHIILPPNHFVGSKQISERIRTTLARNATGQQSSVPAYFDTPFVIEDPVRYQYDMYYFPQGLRVARVRVIFDLPPQFGRLPHPLAYIEWFTALGHPDPVTGMYSVRHSTRHRRPNAEIISVDRIVRSAHLMGKSGRQLNRNWTTSNVLEKAEVFWVNPYINIDMFIATRT